MAGKLATDIRWCVTGTPIGKNGLDDLYGLLLFLRHDPFASPYLWRKGLKQPYSEAFIKLKRNRLLGCRGFEWEVCVVPMIMCDLTVILGCFAAAKDS